MKKILRIILILLVVYIIYLCYHFFHFDNRYRVGNEQYETYVPTTKYENMYPVVDYVDERMNASSILRSAIISSMMNYDDFANSSDKVRFSIGTVTNILGSHTGINKFTAHSQYIEPKAVELKYVGELGDHNFEYTGYLPDGTEVTGNLAVWGTADNVSTAISFQNSDGTIDANKAQLFTDDSNAEMLAYKMVEAIQSYFGTSYEPNQAALTFFGTPLESVAGSISYHAAVSYISTEQPIGDMALEKVKTANISTIDNDSFFVNQAY